MKVKMLEVLYGQCNGFVSQFCKCIRYLVSQVQSELEVGNIFENMVNLFESNFAKGSFGFYLFFGLILF